MHYRLAAAALSVLYFCFLHQAVALPPPGFNLERHPQQSRPTSHPHSVSHPIRPSKNETAPSLVVTGIKPEVKNRTSMSSDATGCGSAHPMPPKYIPGRSCTDNDQVPAANTDRKKFGGKWRARRKPVIDTEGEEEEEEEGFREQRS